MEEEEIYLDCPHCNATILIFIKDINCGIFRHGIYKKDLQQMNPHEIKENCDRLYYNNEIYGCGKPFRLLCNNSNYIAEKCDYI